MWTVTGCPAPRHQPVSAAFTIATEPHLGVKPSATYEFIVIASPSGAYYAEGLDPVKIYVEDEYVRATPAAPASSSAAATTRPAWRAR